MPSVPLGTQAYSRVLSTQPDVRLVNLYMEEDVSGASPDNTMRLQRPGLTRTATLSGPVRGIYQSDNNETTLPLIVAADTVYSVNGSITESIGTVEDDGLTVRIEATFERVAIVSAGTVYLYDGTTLSTLDFPDGEQIIDVDTLDAYLIFAMANGTFFWLVPGETTINALNYATAEALPDGCLAVRRLREELFFFGRNSIEVWQATGDADATFRRADGRLVDRGIMSRDSLAIFDNTFIWVGDDGIVYRMSDVPTRVSSYGIEERIKRRTDDPSGWVFTSYGHKFYVLRIPGEGTYAYDAATKNWSEFSTLNATVWRPTIGRDTDAGAICGDATGAVFSLDPDSPLDDGHAFERLTTGTVAIPATPVANSSIAIGVGSPDPATFSLRWHDPRRGWSEPRTLTSRGEGDILNAWRLGMARAPSRTFEISTISPTVVRISGAMANESWRV